MKKLLKLLFLLSSVMLYAKEYDEYNELVGAAITTTSSLSAESKDYNLLFTTTVSQTSATEVEKVESRGFIYDKTYGLVKLSFDQSLNVGVSSTASVDASIRYQKIYNGYATWYTKDVTLSVTSSATDIKDIDYIKIDDAIKVEVSLSNPVGISDFTGITLKTSCRGEKYSFLSPISVVSNAAYSAPTTRKDGNLYVKWDADIIQNGVTITPEAYELEWTYLSDPEGDGIVYLRDYLFRNNSSRVRVSTNSYFIPLVYEKGIIAFRVRAVGKNTSNGELIDVKSDWTIQENSTSLAGIPQAYLYTYSGLDINLNWSSTISFIEEGKNKASVNYHDGTLKSRQSLARINTEQRVVVGETMYDYNGRPVIQTLPVPAEGTNENNFEYRPHFNVVDDQSGDANTYVKKSDYEVGASGTCHAIAPHFSTKTGASKYYSSENGFGKNGNIGQDILHKDKIPDAEKYSYTQIEYRNDNTDRVIGQSGPGKGHELGSGHEVKKMYGAPNQGEISRLFGNQVGASGHYKKDMVVDANGQLSVSYVNPAGQVVATALTGENSTKLEALPGGVLKEINSELLSETSNKLDSDKKGKTFIHKFNVGTLVNYTFNYTAEVGNHIVSCTGINSDSPVELKLGGVVNVELKLFDNCQDVLFTKQLKGTKRFNTTSENEKLEMLNEVVPANKFKIGEYTLVKSLRIDEEAIASYVKDYFTTSDYTCVLKETDFELSAEDQLDFTSCNATCSQCMDSVEALIDRIEDQQVTLSAAEKVELYERCDVLCLDNITCKGALFGMLAHLAPDGQYGGLREKNAGLASLNDNADVENSSIDGANFSTEEDNNGDPSLTMDNAIVPEKFELSIFNDVNNLQPNRFLREIGAGAFDLASWRKPIKVSVSTYTKPNERNQVIFDADLSSANYTLTDYHNTKGEKIYAYVTKNEDGVTYTPKVSDGATIMEANTEVDPVLYKVTIKDLKDIKEFMKYWEAHFVNYLVPYHPEYGYYVECSSQGELNKYIEEFSDLKLPSDDIDEKFVKKQTSNNETYYIPNVLENDPIFDVGSTLIDGKYQDALRAKLLNYRRKPDDNSNEYLTMAQSATVSVNCPDPTVNGNCKSGDCENGHFPGDKGEEWSAFKGYYIGEREKVLREQANLKAVKGLYYNGCIGTKDYLGSVQRSFLLNNSPKERIQTGTYSVRNCGGWGRVWRRWCSTSTYPTYGYVNTINPEQTCFDGRGPKFEKSTRAFYPGIPLLERGEPVGTVCREIVIDSDGNVGWVEGNCDLGLIGLTTTQQNASAVRSFSDCGHCPLVKELESLVNDVFNEEQLGQNLSSINCATEPVHLSFGRELTTHISAEKNDLLDWTSSYDASSQKVLGSVGKSGLTTALKLEMDFSGSGIPNVAEASKGLDIFKHIRIAGVYTDDQHTNLMYLSAYIELNQSYTVEYGVLKELLEGTIIDASTTPQKTIGNRADDTDPSELISTYRFTIPVTVHKSSSGVDQAIDLVSCDFAPVCKTSSYAEEVVSFLNTLSYRNDLTVEDGGNPIKSYHLNSETSVALTEFGIYEIPARRLLEVAEEKDGTFLTDLNGLGAEWKASPASTSLEGTIKYSLGGNQETTIRITPVNFTGISNVVDFSQVKKFKNIRPFNDGSCTSGECSYNIFYADAVTIESTIVEGVSVDVSVYHRVTIQVSTSDAGKTPVLTKCVKTTSSTN